DGARLRPGQFATIETDAPERFHEHIRATAEQQTELVGPPALAACAIGKEPELLFLDPVFHLSTRTVDFVVKLLRIALQARDDKARVGSHARMFRFVNNPSPALPTPGFILELPKKALLCVAFDPRQHGIDLPQLAK